MGKALIGKGGLQKVGVIYLWAGGPPLLLHGLVGCRVLGAAFRLGCPGLGVALGAGTPPTPGGNRFSERNPEGRSSVAIVGFIVCLIGGQLRGQQSGGPEVCVRVRASDGRHGRHGGSV